MRFVPLRRTVVVAVTLAVVACGLLLANYVPSSVSAPRVDVPVAEATVTPLAIMRQVPVNLPVEHFDAF
jgi:hypothetical protein